MSSVRKAAVGTGYITLMNAIHLGIAFMFYMAIARILTPSEMGEVSLLFLVIAIFNTMTLLALNSAAIRFVSERFGMGKPEEASAAFWGSLKLMTIVAFPSFILVTATSPYLTRFMGGLDAPLVSMALSAGLVLNYTTILGGAFYGLFLYSLVAIQNTVYVGLGRFSAVALAKLGLGVYGVALGTLLGTIACLIYSILAIKGKLRRTRSNFPARQLLSYSAPIYLANIILLAQGWLDIAVLYRITADLAAVGVYYLVVSSTAILTVLPNSIASVLFPTMSYKVGESGTEGAKEILESTVHLSLLIIAPISLALAAVAPTALTIAYGAKYSVGSTVLAVAAFGVIPATMYTLLNSALQAAGHTRPVALAGAVSVLADLVMLMLAVPILSGAGAAMARVMTASAGFTVSYTAIRSRLRYRLSGGWRLLAYSGLTVMPLLFIDWTISLDVLIKGLLELAVFIFTAVILLKILKPFSERERSIIERVVPKNLKPIVRMILR